MANTAIRIKRSTITSQPVSLLSGEFAYSYLSNTLFIGTSDGTGVVNVGGQYYTSQVDQATNLATGSTLVRRDASGNASFNYVFANTIFSSITGNANTATALQNARNFSIAGGDLYASEVSFDGTQNVILNASLNTVPGLVAGVYGGSTATPVITVAANGRIMSIANTSVATSFSIAGDTGTDTFNNGDTLFFVGGAGITSAVTDNTVSFAVDTTVFRSNTAVGKQTVDGDVEISGNLTVVGTQTTINVQTLNIADPLLFLASNNVSDAVDIGFVGHYNDGADRHAGVFRHAGTKEFYVFDNYSIEPNTNLIDIANNNFRTANVNAGYLKGNVIATTITTTSLSVTNAPTFSAALGVPSGGTGQTSFTNGAILVGSGSGALGTLANSTYTATGSGAGNNTITSVTVDAYGRLTAATFSAISGLTVGQGGTGASSFTTNGMVYGNGSDALQVTAAAGTSDQTYSNQIMTVTNAGVPVWSTTLDGGQF